MAFGNFFLRCLVQHRRSTLQLIN